MILPSPDPIGKKMLQGGFGDFSFLLYLLALLLLAAGSLFIFQECEVMSASLPNPNGYHDR